MLQITICTLLVLGVFSLPPKTNPLRDPEWELFKLSYNKMYSPSDEISRRLIWENNLERIEKHNAEYDDGKQTYTMGVNAYSDKTEEEFFKQMNGYRMDLAKPGQDVFMPPNNVGDLPTTVDWRKKGYVTGVKDQKDCASCYAFSATGSLEGQHFKTTGKLISLSEQNIVDCGWITGNRGCLGGFMRWVFEYIKFNNGIDTEASYPYTAKDDGACKFNSTNIGATVMDYVAIKNGSEDDLKIAVATVGPISVGIDSDTSSFMNYKSGIYNEPNCSSVKITHGVLAVGYGVYENHDYWLVKNSWGTSWGMQGYIMMSRNKDNQCGIATQASYPRV